MAKSKKDDGFKINKKIILIIVAICLIAVAGVSLVKSHVILGGETAEVSFKDIGVLNTQVAYCTQIETIENPRKALGIEVPFTTSSAIFSYDVEVKAGVDFSKIKYKVSTGEIIVNMPKSYITGCEIDTASFKRYIEKDNVFSPIKIQDYNKSLNDMKKKAKKSATDNGLLKRADENAQVLVKSFFMKNNEYKDYEIVFK